MTNIINKIKYEINKKRIEHKLNDEKSYQELLKRYDKEHKAIAGFMYSEYMKDFINNVLK